MPLVNKFHLLLKTIANNEPSDLNKLSLFKFDTIYINRKIMSDNQLPHNDLITK